MAAEINKRDIITDGALEAPLVLKKNIDEAIKSIDKLLKISRQSEASISVAKSVVRITEETGKLTKAQQGLADVQKKVALNAKTLWLSSDHVAESVKKEASAMGKSLSVQEALIKTGATLEKNNKAVAQSAKEVEKAYKAEAGSTQALIQKRNQLAKSTEQIKKLMQEELTLMRDGIISESEYTKRILQHEVALKSNAAGMQLLNSQIKNHALLNSNLTGEYKKLTVELESARRKYKDLSASGLASNTVLKDQQQIVLGLEKRVRSIDNAVGQFQRNVGNYPAVFGAAGRTLMQFVSAFGLVTGVYLFAKALKDIVTISIEFEAANSRLAGVLGKTKSEIQVLREQQLKLNETTQFTAKEYAELQIELAKLGFPIEDIKEMTESTALAAIAMGSDLARQAELTGSVLHQYGLDANQTTRINDALSKSTTSSALDFEKLATALPYVGANAAALGFSLEETLALMGQLANSGLQASTIGTSLRKIFLLLADSSSNLSKSFKEPVHDLPSLLKGLKELNLNGTQLADALELTDVRSVTAFQSLIDGAGKVEVLSKTIQDASGFTKELADTVTDNLKGDLIILDSTVSSVATTIGEKLESAMRAAVQSFTSFINLIRSSVTFLKENKDLLLALGLALISFRGAAIQATIANISLTASYEGLKVATIKAIAATRAFFVAWLTNPLGIALAGIAALIGAFKLYDITVGKTAQLNKQFADANNSLADSIERNDKLIKQLTVNEKEYARQTDLDNALNKIKIQYRKEENEAEIKLAETKLKSLKVTAESITLGQQNLILKEKEAGRYDNAEKMLNDFKKANVENNDVYQESKKKIEEQILALENQGIELGGIIKNYDEYAERIKELKRLQDEKANADNAIEENKLLFEIQKANLELDNFRLKNKIEISKKISDNEHQTTETIISELDKQDGYLKKIAKNEYELSLISYNQQKALIKKQVAAKIITEDEGSKQLDVLNRQTSANRIQAAEQLQVTLTKVTSDGEDERAAITYQKQLKAIADAKELSIKEAEARVEARKEAFDSEVTLIQQQVLFGIKTKEQGDREIIALEKQKGEELIQEAIKQQEILLQIEKGSYDESVKLINASEMDEVDKIAAIETLTKTSSERKAEIEKNLAALRKELTQEQYDNLEGLFDKEIEFLEGLYGAIQVYGGAIVGLFSAISDGRVAALDAEISKTQEYYDNEIRLAGDNERAKQELQAESERKRDQLEKKKIAAQIRAAKLAKAIAITEAGIQTAINILKAAGSAPYPANIPLIALAAALGAVQIATIAAKPIPQYAEGTKEGGHVGGPAIVGEKGTELATLPDGRSFLTPGKATMMNLPKGTEVTPNDQTMKMLAYSSLGREVAIERENKALYAKLDSLEQSNVKYSKLLIDAVHSSGNGSFEQHGTLLYKALKKSDGSKKLVRLKSLTE